jgi:hypothetical protein
VAVQNEIPILKKFLYTIGHVFVMLAALNFNGSLSFRLRKVEMLGRIVSRFWYNKLPNPVVTLETAPKFKADSTTARYFISSGMFFLANSSSNIGK